MNPVPSLLGMSTPLNARPQKDMHSWAPFAVHYHYVISGWVDVAWLSDAHPSTPSLTHPYSQQDRGENEMQKLMGQDKDREITHRFLSQAKWYRLEEKQVNSLSCPSGTEIIQSQNQNS